MAKLLVVEDNEMNRTMLAVGCDDYVTKPIDLQQLLAVIETLLPTKNHHHVQ